MTTKNENYQFSENSLSVLGFLKNIKQYAPDNFDYLCFFGASAKEIIKFMESPEKYGDFDFGFVCSMFRAIDKTSKQYIIESPQIPEQTEEDRILASIIMYSNDEFLSIFVNNRLINKSLLTQYLMREDVIYDWNGWLLLNVQQNVERMKAEMRFNHKITG